jgi:hypothetical protein
MGSHESSSARTAWGTVRTVSRTFFGSDIQVAGTKFRALVLAGAVALSPPAADAIVCQSACTMSGADKVVLALYWSASREDNMTVANGDSINAAIGAGYAFARNEGKVFKDYNPGLVPLRLYLPPRPSSPRRAGHGGRARRGLHARSHRRLRVPMMRLGVGTSFERPGSRFAAGGSRARRERAVTHDPRLGAGRPHRPGRSTSGTADAGTAKPTRRPRCSSCFRPAAARGSA